MGRLIEDLVIRYRDGRIGLGEFQQEFADLYFQARKNRNSNLSDAALCNQIVGPLAELSRGHRSEESFRMELENIAIHFRTPA